MPFSPSFAILAPIQESIQFFGSDLLVSIFTLIGHTSTFSLNFLTTFIPSIWITRKRPSLGGIMHPGKICSFICCYMICYWIISYSINRCYFRCYYMISYICDYIVSYVVINTYFSIVCYFLISLCWFYNLVGQYVSKLVSQYVYSSVSSEP